MNECISISSVKSFNEVLQIEYNVDEVCRWLSSSSFSLYKKKTFCQNQNPNGNDLNIWWDEKKKHTRKKSIQSTVNIQTTNAHNNEMERLDDWNKRRKTVKFNKNENKMEWKNTTRRINGREEEEKKVHTQKYNSSFCVMLRVTLDSSNREERKTPRNECSNEVDVRGTWQVQKKLKKNPNKIQMISLGCRIHTEARKRVQKNHSHAWQHEPNHIWRKGNGEENNRT